MELKHGGIKQKGQIECVKCGKFYRSKDCLRKHKCKKPGGQPTTNESTLDQQNPIQHLENLQEEIKQELSHNFAQQKRPRVVTGNQLTNNEASCLSVGDYLRKPEDFQITTEESHAITQNLESANHDAQIQEIMTENRRLKEENLRLQKQVQDLGLQSNRQSIDYEHLSQKIELLKQQNQKSEEEAQNCKKQQKNDQLESQKVESQLKEKLGYEIKVLETQIISLQKERKHQQSMIEELNLKLTKKDSGLQSLQQQFLFSKEECSALTKRVKDYCLESLPQYPCLAPSYFKRFFPKEQCPDYMRIFREKYPKEYREHLEKQKH